MTRQWEWQVPARSDIQVGVRFFAEMTVTPCYLAASAVFCSAGIPNGDTHHLEVCAEEEILQPMKSRAGIGTLEG